MVVADIIELFAKIAFMLMVILAFYSPIIGWLERKQSALMQDRIGANRASIFGFKAIGLFHMLADVIKIVSKEDFIPKGANKFFHTLAPFIALFTILASFTVIPFGGSYILFGHSVHLIIADLDIGILLVFAFAGLSSYSTILAGWASNNNWSLLGGLRGTAQMLSYEVAMGLGLTGVIMVYGSIQLDNIAMAQSEFFRWGIFLQPLGFLIFFICSIAENKRIPFDIPEAESEIVAGYFTEYSGLKFIMFWMSEYLEIVLIACLTTIMFLGAWYIPFINHDHMILYLSDHLGKNLGNIIALLISVGVFFGKVSFIILLLMSIRWSLPRFRYDQLMGLGWKTLLPLSILNIIITGVVILFFD